MDYKLFYRKGDYTMSTAMYEITNEKSDFEKGYLDIELQMVNAKELKVIDTSMFVMPEDTEEGQ